VAEYLNAYISVVVMYYTCMEAVWFGMPVETEMSTVSKNK